MAERRRRILVLNQYYWPGVEATAHLLADLCRALSDEFDITVITGMLRNIDADVRAGVQYDQAVKIVRVNSAAYDRSKLPLRAVNYATYLLQSLRYGFRAERPDLVLCMTDPPVIPAIALLIARRFRAPMVQVSQDVFPEVAVELGRLRNKVLISFLGGLVNYSLARADRVVAIGDTMRRRLITKGARPDRVSVIPNWIDTTAVRPMRRDNDWAHEQGLVDKFVVMHSGNVGHAQDLDSLVRAATFLRDLERLEIVVIGAGARHAEVTALAELHEVDSVRFLPYQPREVLSQSLSTAHLHVVGLARGLSGYVVPSRLYGILAAGRPVIAAVESESETAQVVSAAACGVVVPPARPERLAAVIRSAYEGELDLEEMGRRGRAFVEAEGDRLVAIERYRRLLREVSA